MAYDDALQKRRERGTTHGFIHTKPRACVPASFFEPNELRRNRQRKAVPEHGLIKTVTKNVPEEFNRADQLEEGGP
jgi:hypothetical protein